jgi:signal transduction histidine kinase
MTFPEQVQIALYRIAQESLNNVLKHAGATTVQLHLDCRGQQTVLRVSDDGCGFDLDDHTAGMGLRLMQQRADSIGAQFSIDSECNVGTSITVKWEHGSEVNA